MKGLLALVLLSACGGPPAMNPVFKPYVDKLATDSLAHGLSFEASHIVFASEAPSEALGKDEKGLCIKETYRNFIIIDDTWWSTHGEMERQSMVMHEEGHCAFGMNHYDNEIMNPLIIPFIPLAVTEAYFDTAKEKEGIK